MPKRTELSKSSTLTNVPVDQRRQERESMLLNQDKAALLTSLRGAQGASLAFSGSNQARKGRLANALAVRGDEGRDTLR